MIKLKPVISSNLAATGYDPATQVLAVRFNGSDQVHHYKDVPADIAVAMDASPSVGRYFAANIRPKFDHEVIDGSAESA